MEKKIGIQFQIFNKKKKVNILFFHLFASCIFSLNTNIFDVGSIRMYIYIYIYGFLKVKCTEFSFSYKRLHDVVENSLYLQCENKHNVTVEYIFL